MDLRELLAGADVVEGPVPAVDVTRFSHMSVPGVSVLFKVAVCRVALSPLSSRRACPFRR